MLHLRVCSTVKLLEQWIPLLHIKHGRKPPNPQTLTSDINLLSNTHNVPSAVLPEVLDHHCLPLPLFTFDIFITAG